MSKKRLKILKENKAVQWLEAEANPRNNWFIFLVAKPNVYLNNLTKRTFVMGGILLLFYFAEKYFGITEQAIPSTIHSIVGLVIGLLLVFRTNTAYERWWEARKIFAVLETTFLYIRIKFAQHKNSEKASELLKNINSLIFEFVSIHEGDKSDKIKEEIIKNYHELSVLIGESDFPNYSLSQIERKMIDLLESFSALERIRNTPIPVSYSLHIKLSVFAYLLTLPFGMFFGLGLGAIPLVMILFFIIAGIEIISTEIENPFRGDPNDLPIEDFKKENEKYING